MSLLHPSKLIRAVMFHIVALPLLKRIKHANESIVLTGSIVLLSIYCSQTSITAHQQHFIEHSIVGTEIDDRSINFGSRRNNFKKL